MRGLVTGLLSVLGSVGERVTAKAARAGAGAIAKDLTRVHKGQLMMGALGFVLPVLSSRTIHDPAARRSRLIQDLSVTALVMGYRHGTTQMFMSQALLAAFEAPAIGRGVVNGLRTGIQHRTMAAVPFSMTQINQQQAYASLEYARSRMGAAYSTIGNEAAMFSARYLQR